MSDDTISSSSTTPEKHKKHKKHKKLKRKSEKKKSKHKEKKDQRHKDKKRVHKEKIRVSPTIPPTIPSQSTENEPENADCFGPALPPHLRKSEPKTLIGPMMPHEFLQSTSKAEQNESADITNADNATATASDDDDIDYSYGPMPVPTDADGVKQMSATQIELEQRALELKLAAIEGTMGQGSDAKVREEWMLELPEVGLKSGLAAIANMKRTFHQGKERPDFTDRSSWTKTPQDAANPTPSTSKSATTVEALQRKAESAYEQKRDEEQARLAKKHKKDHKRDESLVELHQKKLRKEQKRREKELAASGAKPERRPFSRDVDLKLNKIDSNQTKQIVDKAKILNTKFATGKTKYL